MRRFINKPVIEWSLLAFGVALLILSPLVGAIPGPGGFKPLQSGAVKDAIHRALRSGQTQRWADGELSGYAVPSETSLANGCRAIRYTIDQQPEVPYRSLTACE